MPNRLEVPPELAALIEKRERERRAEIESETSLETAPAQEERRSGEDRRNQQTNCGTSED